MSRPEDDDIDFEADDQVFKEEEQQRRRELMERFTPEQMERYEAYRRSGFSKNNIKRILAQYGHSVNPKMTIVVAGVAKVFVGEVVEEALSVMEAAKESGPLRPRHIREAVRRLQRKPGTRSRHYRNPVFAPRP